MPLLQVRDMPEDLYKTLADVAKQDNRSIAQETIILLKRALNYRESRQSRRKRILKEIHNNPVKGAESFPPPVDLILEDRER